VLNGWSLSGVTTIQDGQPITFVDSNAGTAYGTQGNGNGNNGRAQLCGNGVPIATPGGDRRRAWEEPAADPATSTRKPSALRQRLCPTG
jgi:hypothetical protein